MKQMLQEEHDEAFLGAVATKRIELSERVASEQVSE